MAKLQRYIQKIFGNNAGTNERSVFGSLAEGTPDYSMNPGTIQSRGAFEGGWYSSVLGNNSPAIQDRNSLDFLLTYQLAYLLQSGIPEWEVGTEYSKNSSFVSDGDGKIYLSVADLNIGNVLSDESKWLKVLDKEESIKRAAFKNMTQMVAIVNAPIDSVVKPVAFCDFQFIKNRDVVFMSRGDEYVNLYYRGQVGAIDTGGGAGLFFSSSLEWYQDILFVSNSRVGVTNSYCYSIDGENFTQVNPPVSAVYAPLTISSHGANVVLFLAETDARYFLIDANNPVNATLETLPVTPGKYETDITFGESNFILIGKQNVTNEVFIYRSVNGAAWTDIGANFPVTGIHTTGFQSARISYGNGFFLVTYLGTTSSSGDTLFSYKSTDNGLTWTHHIIESEDKPFLNISTEYVGMRHLSFVNGVFILSSNDYGHIFTTIDGEVWDRSQVGLSIYNVVEYPRDKMAISVSSSQQVVRSLSY